MIDFGAVFAIIIIAIILMQMGGNKK